MSRKNRKDRSTGKRKGRKIRLIAASATASAVIAVSPYIASASGTSAAVTAALDGGGSDASSVLDDTKQDEEKKEEKEDQKENQKDPESGKTEEEKHTESNSEAAERKMFESMLKEAESVKGMTKHYGYAESKGPVSRSDIHSGNIVSIDDVFYIVAEYEDTDGNSQKVLWREDGSGSFMAGTEFPEKCDHVYTLEKKEPDVSVPEGLTGAEGQKLSEVTLPDGFSWKNPDTELAAGKNTCEAVYTPQNTVVYSEKTVSVTVKATPKVHELTLPSPSYSVSYSPDMKASDITLPDNWAFESPDAKISLGTDVYKVVFTGDKKLSWSAPTDDVTVKITASKKHVSFDGVFVTVNQGTALTDSILPETAGGRLSWKTTGLKADAAGTFTYYAIYVPDDLDRFEVTDNIPVTVTVRAPKELKRPESSYSVVYEPGTKVSTIALPENWAFDTPDATIAAGTHTYRVSFTGDKTDNWAGSTDSFDVSITATKRTISVDPISITVDEGATLSDSMLPSIPGGTLKWKTAGENAGSTQSVHYAVFYPTDSDRYDSTDSVAVTVSVRKKAVTPTPPSKNTGSDKGESEVIDKVDDKPSKPSSSDKNSDKSSDKTDKTSDKTDKTPSKNSDKTSNKDDKSSGKTDKVSDGPSDAGNGYKPVSSTKDSTKSDTAKNDTPSSADTSKTATPSNKSSDGDDDTPVTAKGSKKAKSDDDMTDRDAPAKKSTKGTKGTAAVYPKKPSSSDSSASSLKPKKKIKLKNISDSQIIPVVAPSAAEKKTSSPSVSNVEAKPVTGSDTHSSTLKDVDVSAVKPSDKGSGKSSEKKKNKKKTSDSDVYTPDDTNSLHAKEDTPDQMFNSASGVKDDNTGKNAADKKVASPSSAKKSNIGIIAAGGAVAAAAVGAGVYVFMKKRNGEDSEFDISGAVTRGDDDDDDDDGSSLHGF